LVKGRGAPIVCEGVKKKKTAQKHVQGGSVIWRGRGLARRGDHNLSTQELLSMQTKLRNAHRSTGFTNLKMDANPRVGGKTTIKAEGDKKKKKKNFEEVGKTSADPGKWRETVYQTKKKPGISKGTAPQVLHTQKKNKKATHPR